VVMTFSGYRLDPNMPKEERADKTKNFINFMTKAKIPALDAWIGPTRTGNVVPIHLVLGRALLDDGSPNMEVVWPAVLLLSSQAREAQEVYEAPVMNEGDRDGGRNYKGWAPVGNEGLVGREPVPAVNFDPVRIVVQLERNQLTLNTCPPFKAGEKAMGRYVPAKTCPVQSIIDVAFPRLLDEVFTPDFDKEAARSAREEQRKREKRERDDKEATGHSEAGAGPPKTPKMTGRGAGPQNHGSRTGARGGGSSAGAGRGYSTQPPTDLRDRDRKNATGSHQHQNDSRSSDGGHRREHDGRGREGSRHREYAPTFT
jgi:hypothetical protein